MVEHFDDRPQLQQPTKRSPHFDFFVGGGLLGDDTLVSSVSALAWLVSSRGVEVMASLRSLFYVLLHLVSCEYSRDASIKASLFILIVMGLTAAVDDLNGARG